MKVLTVVVICCSIYSVSCYGPPPKSKKVKSTTTEAAPSDDGIIFPGQENNVNTPVSYIQNSGVGSYGGGSPNYQALNGGCGGGPTGSCGSPQGQPSYNPQTPSQGQQSQPSLQQPGGNYWWQGASSPFNPQQQPPSVSSQSPGSNLPPQNAGQASPPNNHNQQGYVPTQPGPSQSQPAGASPPKPIDIHNNPFLSSALAGNKPSSCGSYGGGACNPQAPNQGVPTVNPPLSNQPIACGPGSTGGCNTGVPPNSPLPQSPQGQAPIQPGSPSNPVGNQPGGFPSKPVDINNNPFLSSALNNYKPSNGCSGSYSGNCGANQQQNLGNPQNPSGQNQYPIPQQPQYPSQYPGSQQPVGGSQVPGSQSKPLHPGLSQIPGPQQPGQPQGNPQYPGSHQPEQPQGNPQYPGSQQSVQPQGDLQYPENQRPGQSIAYPGTQPQLKPQGGQQYPGTNQYPNSQQPGPLGSQQYPGGSQYPSYQQAGQPSQGSPQSPQSSYQGLPQGNQKYPGSSPNEQPGLQGNVPQPSGQAELPLKYPGSHAPGPSSQNPGNKYKNPQQPGGQYHSQQPGDQYHSQQPGEQPTVNIPGNRPQQYPSSPSQVKPSYPQYGSGPTPGQQYTPQFPSSGVPCNQHNELCVTKSACQQGVLTQNGVPGRAGFCNAATEVCCKIPTGATPDKQAPPTISYGNRPGTNGIPIGGSIYDTYPKPSLNSVTPAPTQQPYTGPLNTTPYPGCPAALKCVPISYCTAEGVMADNPVSLTREQQENRVPLTDCMNLETNIQGKCCRDPNYKDPWPAGMMMGKTPAGGNFDDGQYHPPATDNGQYHPPAEQETSGTFSHEAGLYYNAPSSTPKGHTIKKPIGNFNQNPTAFPTKPAFVNGAPVRQPAPVHEKEYSEGVNPPSNEILPPNSDTNASINPDSKLQPGGQTYQPGQVNQANKPSYQLSQLNPVGGGSYRPTGSGYQPIQPNQLIPNEPVPRPDQPSFQSQPPNGQPLFQPNPENEQKQPGNTNPSYQPGQPDSSYQAGRQPTYQPSSPANEQPAKGFPIAQPRPGSSCGIRHQDYTSPEDAGFAEFPWQALVSSASNKTYVCGAAIIAQNAVITAAHCVEELRSKEIVIKAGEWKLLSPSEKPVQVRPAAAVARHPQFSIQTLSNDLAIIVTSQAFTFDDHVDKICLPSTLKPTYDQSSTCVVTGWGRKQLKGPIPGSVLHKVDVTFIPEDKCELNLRSTHLGKYFILNKGFSCAVPKNPSDLCKVDVGSPIACDRGDGHYELAGVNSWDVGCQTDQMPTISSNPDAEWIDKVINTPAEELAKEEEKYFADKLKGESIDEVDIDQKPGFALGYGK